MATNFTTGSHLSLSFGNRGINCYFCKCTEPKSKLFQYIVMKQYNSNYPLLDKFCLTSWVKRLPRQNCYEVKVSDLVSYFKYYNCTKHSITELIKELIFDGSINGEVVYDRICIYT